MGISRHRNETWLNKLIYVCILLFLTTVALDGVVRYIGTTYGAPWIVYLPKMIAVALIATLIARALLKGQFKPVAVWVVLIILYSTAIGAVYVGNTLQVLFGIYMLIPFMLGVTAYPYFVSRFEKLAPFVQIIFGLTVIGVLLDRYLQLPWEGLDYEIGEFTVTASRYWKMFGVDRLAGFTRASTEAAAITVISGFLFVITAKKRWLKIMGWIVAGVVVTLTTSKGLIAAYILLSGFIVFRSKLIKPVWGAGLSVIAGTGVMLPLSYLLILYSERQGRGFDIDLLSTLKMRLATTWPTFWQNLGEYGNYILGRGMGSLGAAQLRFEPDRWDAIDNIYLYLYGHVGVFLVGIVLFLVIRGIKLVPLRDKVDEAIAGMLLIILAYGITNNIMQGAYLSFALGLVIARLGTGRSKIKPALKEQAAAPVANTDRILARKRVGYNFNTAKDHH